MDETPPASQSSSTTQQEQTTQARAWAGLMHDLRSPLTVVLGRAQLARRHLRHGDGVARVDADLEALEAAVSRLVAVVERLDRGGRFQEGPYVQALNGTASAPGPEGSREFPQKPTSPLDNT